MKALGEEGLDVLVEEIKKRSAGGDGSDGKNGSVVDELDEILRTMWRLYQKKYDDGHFNGFLKDENLESHIVGIVNKFCQNIAMIYHVDFYDGIKFLPNDDIVQDIDTILQWVHEKLYSECVFTVMTSSNTSFNFTLFDL